MLRTALLGLVIWSTTSLPATAGLIGNETGLAWAARRDLTSAEFSDAFKTYKAAGYIIIDVDAYPTSNGLRYSMVWQDNIDGRGWAEHRDLTSAQYHDKWVKYRDLGYRPLDVEAYKSGSQLRFAGIWIKNTENLGWSSKRGLTSAEYADYFKEQRDLGRRPVDIEAYNTSDGLRFAAIWYENKKNLKWVQLRNLTRQQYQDAVDEQTGKGLRVIDYESYSTSGGQRYAAIWEKNPAGRAWTVRSDRTTLQYANLFRQYADEGYRLVDFERYDTPQGSRTAGIWIENDSRFDYARKGTLDDIVKTYRNANDLPGISVAVIRNGKMLYRRGFGWADVDNEKVAHGGTVYNAASVSKVIGGTLAAKLEDEQVLHDGTEIRLDLSLQTARYLTNIPIGDGQTATIPSHHTHQVDEVLAHLGCIAHYDTTPAIPNQTQHYDSAVSAVRSIWDVQLVQNCTVGSTRSYSTAGFTFVGAVLERATGRNIVRLVNEELVQPYNLGSMRVQFEFPVLPSNYDRAVPYDNDNDAIAYQDSTWKVLGGGIEVSAVDLARFGWKTLNGDIVQPDARDGRMWSPVRSGCDGSISGACSGGLAWGLNTIGGRRVVEHSGSWTGARSFIRVFRDDGLVIAIMSNRRGHSVDDVNGLATKLGNAIFAP